MKIIDKDRGFSKLTKTVKALSQSRRKVKIGVNGKDAGARNDGLDNVTVGSVHEYGSKEHGIPQRSFIGATIDEHQGKYVDQARKLLMAVLEGRISTNEALAKLGESAKRDMIARINDGIDPPNSEATVKAKGSSKPLIDTGSLKQSINYVVDGDA